MWPSFRGSHVANGVILVEVQVQIRKWYANVSAKRNYISMVVILFSKWYIIFWGGGWATYLSY